MTQVSTQHQLLRYAYGELPLLDRLETEFAIEEQREVREGYEELQASLRELPRVTFRPATATLKAVLRYSRNSTFETSPN